MLAQVLARTDGVPLFVEELTRAVLESGLLRDEGDRYALAGPLPPLAIPSTLQDSLMARLDRLAPVKEVAQVAACIGREFGFELLEAVGLPATANCGPRSASSWRPSWCSAAASAAIRVQARAGAGRRVREPAQGPTAAAARPDRGGAGGALPRMAAAEPELLAQHYAGAGLAERAITYWLTAARLALARSANAEAVAQLDKGLALLGQLQDDPGRHRLELDLQAALGAALIAAKGFAAPETGRAWARALELCRGLPDTPPLPHVLYGVWAFHLNRAELDVALKVAGEVRTLGNAGDDPVLRLMGHRALGNTLVSRGEVVRGRAELERALAIDLPPDRRLGLEYTFHPRVSSLGFIGWALVALGYPDQALSRAREAVATARELRNPNSLAQALFFNSSVAQLLGDRQESGRLADELEALAEQHGFPFWLAAARVMRGRALADGGETEAGLNLMRSGVDAYTATGGRDFRPYFRALLAEAALGPDPAAAGDVLTRTLEEVGATGGRWIEPELHRLRGELLLAGPEPDLDGAEAAFVRAVAVAARYRMRLWELRAATSLARVRAPRRDRTGTRPARPPPRLVHRGPRDARPAPGEGGARLTYPFFATSGQPPWSIGLNASSAGMVRTSL